MLIKNHQKDRLPSELTISEFAHAMKQQDLSTVPPEKRKAAIFDHFMSVMADGIRDPEAKFEILMSQQMRRKNA